MLHNVCNQLEGACWKDEMNERIKERLRQQRNGIQNGNSDLSGNECVEGVQMRTLIANYLYENRNVYH